MTGDYREAMISDYGETMTFDYEKTITSYRGERTTFD